MAGIAEQMRQAVLQAAIQGKLTEQLPEDGDARDLLAEIQAEKVKLIAEKKIKKEKPLEPISKEEMAFVVPTDWAIARLGDIGIYKKGPFGSALTKSIFVPKSVNTIKVYEQKNAIKKDASLGNYYITEEYFLSKMKGFEVFPGDIIVSCAGTIGEAYVLPDEMERGIINQALMRIKLSNRIDKNYFLLFFDYFLKASAKENSKGSAIKNIPPFDILKGYVIPIPPLAEQHRIVARVGELMAKIDELEKVENELNALHKAFPGDMKAALLQAAMQGKLTEQLPEDGNVDALLLAIEEERNGLIAKKEIKKDVLENLTDTPFDVPESWRWVKLNNIVIKNIKRGKSPTYAPNSHILVFAQKCNTKVGYINMDLALFLDEDKAKKYPNSEYMQDADTIINSTGNGTLGRVGFYKESDNPRHFPVVPDSHVTVVRTSSKLNKKYVMYCLKYYQPYFEKKCTGSTNQTELGVDIVKNLPFPVPPIKEQQRIVEKLDKLLPLCDSLEEKL